MWTSVKTPLAAGCCWLQTLALVLILDLKNLQKALMLTQLSLSQKPVGGTMETHSRDMLLRTPGEAVA